MFKQWQLIFSFVIIHLGLAFFIYPENVISSTHAGHWEVISVGYALELAMVVIYVKGLDYFPKKDLTELLKDIGTWSVYFVLVPLVIYFIMCIVITIRAHAEIITMVFLPNSPISLISLLLLVIPLYAALKGIDTILRTSILLFFVFIPVVIFVIFFSTPNLDVKFAFPIFINPKEFALNPSFIISTFAFTGFLYVGMVRSHTPVSINKILASMLIVLPFYFIAVYLPILTFGQETAINLSIPFVTAMDSIRIEWLMFERVTMFYMLSLITFVLYFVALLLWMSGVFLKTLINKTHGKLWITGVAIISYFGAINITNYSDIDWLFTINTFFRLFAIIFIPLFILLAGIVLQRRNKVENN